MSWTFKPTIDNVQSSTKAALIENFDMTCSFFIGRSIEVPKPKCGAPSIRWVSCHQFRLRAKGIQILSKYRRCSCVICIPRYLNSTTFEVLSENGSIDVRLTYQMLTCGQKSISYGQLTVQRRQN